MSPITEDEIANFLAHTPGFFERHAELLASIQLSSPHAGRAVGLQERQAQLLRDKIRALERRVMEMIRAGNENVLIADKLHRWVLDLMRTAEPTALPETLLQQLEHEFLVPQSAIKLWDVAPGYLGQAFAQGVSDNARLLASSLTVPYCGANTGFEAVGWLPDASSVASLALLPLRVGPINSPAPAFGLLVLASPDPQRFNADMGTDFLERIAELASAALSRLRE